MGNVSFRKHKLSRMQVMWIYEQIGELDTMNIEDTLSTVYETSDNEKIKRFVLFLRTSIKQGKKLGETIGESDWKNSFDSAHIELIKSGDSANKLHEVLRHLAAEIEESDDMRAKFLLILLYPAFLLVVITVVVGILLAKVIPSMASVFMES